MLLAFLIAAVSIAGIFAVIEAREPRLKLALAIAAIGFVTMVGATIELYRAMLAGSPGAYPPASELAALSTVALARSWLFVAFLGGIVAVTSIALLGGRFHRRFLASGLAVVISGVIIIQAITGWPPRMDALERAAVAMQLCWLVAIAIAASAIVRSPMRLSEVGFRRANRASWLLCLTSVLMLGVSLGGVPSSDRARDIFHTIATALSLSMVIGTLGVVWGAITAMRLDEPRAARWMLGIGSLFIAFVAAARLLELVSLSGGMSMVVIDERRELVVLGLGCIAVMVACHLVVRRRGIHELRNGFLARLVIVVAALVIIVVLDAPPGSLGVAPSPASILQAILRVVTCVMLTRELGELAGRINRAPQLPTARATIASANDV